MGYWPEVGQAYEHWPCTGSVFVVHITVTGGLVEVAPLYEQFFYSVSQKKSLPPKDLWQFFQNGWLFLFVVSEVSDVI